MFTFAEETHRKKRKKKKKKKHSRRHRSAENSPVLPYTPYIGLATASNAYATSYPPVIPFQPQNGLQGTSSPQAMYNVSSYPPSQQIQPNANSYYTSSPYPHSSLTPLRSHSPQLYVSRQPPPASPMRVEAPVIPPFVHPPDKRGVCHCVSWK
ncbi:hypothetical protein CPC08DRAFT_766998 [Agrocybe pediades]|nr:hypothetical protein CPC08DRAFT_766998 [Agrocybe pediades]